MPKCFGHTDLFIYSELAWLRMPRTGIFVSFIKGKQISPRYFLELSSGKVIREGDEVKLVKELLPRRQEIVRRNFEC